MAVLSPYRKCSVAMVRRYAVTHSIKTSAAAQQEKWPFVVGAAKFGEPMTEL